MNKPIFALSVFSAFLAGLLVGPWLRPPTPSAPPPVEAQAAPPLPVAPPLPPAPPAEPPPPAAELLLKGVLAGADPSRSRALIAYGDGSPKLYKVDEKLPDGSVLKSVGNKAVEVEKDGQTRTVPLNRGSSPAEELELLTPDSAVTAPAPEAATSPTPAGSPSPTETPESGTKPSPPPEPLSDQMEPEVPAEPGEPSPG